MALTDVGNTEPENKCKLISFHRIHREEVETETPLNTGFLTNREAVFFSPPSTFLMVLHYVIVSGQLVCCC